MKFRLNKRYLMMSMYAALAIALGGILILLASNIDKFGSVFNTLSSILKPVIWALAIAYILNPVMCFFEYRLFKGWRNKADTSRERRAIHSLSLFLTAVVSIMLIIGFFWLIVPQLVASLTGMVEKFDTIKGLFVEAEAWVNLTFGANSVTSEISENILEEVNSFIFNSWENLKPQILPFLTQMGSEVVNAFGTLFNLTLAFVIALNMLSVKEMLLKQSRKMMYCFIRRESCDRMLEVLGKSNKIFKRYIIGLSIDSVIVGTLCFVGSAVMGIQYALLIGIIFAVCNFIPMFGPFIGAVPASLVILTDDPVKVIWFLIFLIIIQQIDGNILVPLIQGDAMGVPSVWVLISITIGGGFFGFIGMLLAVPVFAIIYMLIKELTEGRLAKIGLPVSTHQYGVALNTEYPNVNAADEYEKIYKEPLLKRIYKFFKVLFKRKKEK